MRDKVARIKVSGLTIYDPIPIDSPLYLSNLELEQILQEGLSGFSTAGMPIRTRSKEVKAKICEILGYPVPASFAKTRPRFPGQDFDTYIQKSNNLQIWNEEITSTRRYVLIKEQDRVLTRVRVINGQELARLDTTGTLTQKFQARFIPTKHGGELLSPKDTTNLSPYIITERADESFVTEMPIDYPKPGKILGIEDVFVRLQRLVGLEFEDPGRDQERNRGAILHQEVCRVLGYRTYQDNGQFPDVANQLIEIKLQTSPTVDLGLVEPNSKEPCELPRLGNAIVRHCDVRYAVFDAKLEAGKVKILGVYLTTGEEFFKSFQQFGGKVVNKKIQIPLPIGLL